MATKLIELEDGTLVEVEIPTQQVQQISGGFTDKVNATFDKIHPILTRICRPITTAWQEISQDVDIAHAEIELGLGFEGEGNIFITKSKVSANLTVKLVFKPKT